MADWRRLILGLLAAVLTASPTLACADFCPDTQPATSSDDAVTGGMPDGCEDRMGATPAPVQDDEDCSGCMNCATAAQLEKPAPIAAASVTPEAPVLIVVDAPFADDYQAAGYGRSRLIPPSIGPPALATPVALGNFLRL